MVYGSGQLVDALVQFGLVDEYQLWLHPVILGNGKRLFKPDAREANNSSDFTLANIERFTSGVLLLHYQKIKTNKNENDSSTTQRRVLKR
jgi:dihydrofolate reductase